MSGQTSPLRRDEFSTQAHTEIAERAEVLEGQASTSLGGFVKTQTAVPTPKVAGFQ